MGEAVNIAFRLETATKECGCDVLIAQEVFRALLDVHFMPEGMIEVDLKGYDHRFPALGLNFGDIHAFVERFLAA